MRTETIINWVVSALKPFRRNKIPAEKKSRAVELYLKGLSYRQVARILGISHTTVWETVQKLAEAVKSMERRDTSGLRLMLKAGKSSQSGSRQLGTGGLPGISF